MYELLEAYLSSQGISQPQVRTLVKSEAKVNYTYTYEYSIRDQYFNVKETVATVGLDELLVFVFNLIK